MKITNEKIQAIAAANLNQPMIGKIVDTIHEAVDGAKALEQRLELTLAFDPGLKWHMENSLFNLLGDGFDRLAFKHACHGELSYGPKPRIARFTIKEEENLSKLANAGVEFPGADLFRDPALSKSWAARG